MKLKWKLTILITLILGGTFIFSALLGSIRVQKSSKKIIDALSIELMEAKANEVSGWLNQRIRELHTISNTPTVKSMEEEALKAYVNALSRDMDKYYGNSYGTFGINDFSGLEYINEELTIDVSDRAYFRRMKESDEVYHFSDPVFSKTDGSRITVLCYSVYNEKEEKVGFVAASLSLEKLTEIAQGGSIYGGKSIIINAEGTFYTLGEDLFSSAVQASIKEGIPCEQSSQVTQKSIDDHQQVFYAPINGSENWYLCTVVDQALLYKEAKLLTESLGRVFIIMFFIGVVGIMVFSGQITKRISKLSLAMDEVQKGNFTAVLEVQGKDEIGELTKHYNFMVKSLTDLMKKVVATEKEKRHRELQVLQAQINPHFVYNTLDTIHWKALASGSKEVSELINALSSFFRGSLSKGREFITVKEELQHVESYLDIQKVRYGALLDFHLSVDEALLSIEIPKIIIQPMVENAIYHGIKPKLMEGHIWVKGQRDGNYLVLQVMDDGVGMTQEVLEKLMLAMEDEESPLSYGLYNIAQRLKLYYGGNAVLDIESIPLEGTKVTLKLPLERKEFYRA